MYSSTVQLYRNYRTNSTIHDSWFMGYVCTVVRYMLHRVSRYHTSDTTTATLPTTWPVLLRAKAPAASGSENCW